MTKSASIGYSKKLGPPIVAAAVATLVLTSFSIVLLVLQHEPTDRALFASIWPILLASSTAIILVMSLLHRALLSVVLELERREASAQHLAVHDALTGLGNRALFEERLNAALGRHRRHGEGFALLLLDLDRFKAVNDTFGHAAGDALVSEIARRLRGVIRDVDTIARIGGDEFALIQSRIGTEADVRALCERVVEAVREPMTIGGKNIRVGASVGAVLVDDPDIIGSELIRRADITMYRAKSLGRNCFQLFSGDMDNAVHRRMAVETRLRQALAGGTALDLHYQPQLDADGGVCAVEGLLRWHDSELGNLSPGEVVPIAEETGLMQELGEHIFRRACMDALRWPQLKVAVNISSVEFRRRDLPARLRAIAADVGVPCNRIELEITEKILIQDPDFAEAAVRKLHEAGFAVALDDFGTGYSSLSYLQRFPVDKIKLDRGFIESAQTPDSIAVLEAAVQLGHALHLQVVAEGISSAEQEAVALSAGCDAVQGFYYARAMRAEEIADFVASWNDCSRPPLMEKQRRARMVSAGRC